MTPTPPSSPAPSRVLAGPADPQLASPTAVERLVYTVGEEVANSVTHGLGLLLALVGTIVLVTRAAATGDDRTVVASAVFGIALVLLYGASTLYHALPSPRAKAFCRVLDHACIYLLIAGTYTPFTLLTLRGPWGWGLFVGVWVMAIAGVMFKLFFTGRFSRLSTALYVAMGWCLLVAIKPLTAALAPKGMALLAAGGVAYTGGVVFYQAKRLRYSHAVWHSFVLAGSALHFFAVLLYVIPKR